MNCYTRLSCNIFDLVLGGFYRGFFSGCNAFSFLKKKWFINEVLSYN